MMMEPVLEQMMNKIGHKYHTKSARREIKKTLPFKGWCTIVPFPCLNGYTGVIDALRH
jgi:hypothetical protein